MRALLTVLWLAAAATGANDSLAETESGGEVCVQAELRRVTVTPDVLPVALLASARLLGERPWLGAGWEWDGWARELLETHRDIQVSEIFG